MFVALLGFIATIVFAVWLRREDDDADIPAEGDIDGDYGYAVFILGIRINRLSSRTRSLALILADKVHLGRLDLDTAWRHHGSHGLQDPTQGETYITFVTEVRSLMASWIAYFKLILSSSHVACS